MRMRSKAKSPISVHAIAGTEVVLLGLDADEEATKGLVGFAIDRLDHKTRKTQSVPEEWDSHERPIKKFLWGDYEAEPNTTYTYTVTPVYTGRREGEAVKVKVTTENPEVGTHGIYFNRGVAGSQKFSELFGDYRRFYLDEKPAKIEEVIEDSEPVTEDKKIYARAFIKPQHVPDRQAYTWLSRGLEEAMLGFIKKARNKDYAIRAAVYELTYVPAIQEFVNALERGVDVKIVHHAKRTTLYRLKGMPRQAKGEPKPDPPLARPSTQTTWTPADGPRPKGVFDPKTPPKMFIVKEVFRDSVSSAAAAAVSEAGLRKFSSKNLLDQMLIERTITSISHNKFIILLKKGVPEQVWTGSTNFTEGGIFGQSNVGHIVRDEKVAKKYLDYWNKLATDPKKKSAKTDLPDAGIQNWTAKQQADLNGPPPVAITPVFSPRLPKKKDASDMLDWYANRLDAAQQSVFFTAAFSVANQFMEVLKEVKRVQGEPYAKVPYQRYVMLEGTGGMLSDKFPELRKCPQNRIAWGDTLKRPHGKSKDTKKDDHKYDEIETLTGLNDHVNYLHTKYMLLDPLSDDPIVISGSANFSEASTEDNDENMLIIRGNTRVADVYLGEFMRLFNHFRSRNERNHKNAGGESPVPPESPPKTWPTWTAPYYDPETQEYQERKLFA